MIRIHIQVDAETQRRAHRVGKLVTSRVTRVLGVSAVLTMPFVANASPVSVPNTFQAGTVISSSLVNDNFGTLAASINDNDQRIATLEADSPMAGCTWQNQLELSAYLSDVVCPAGQFAATGGCRSNADARMQASSPIMSNGQDPLAGLAYTGVVGWHCGFEIPSAVVAMALCCPMP